MSLTNDLLMESIRKNNEEIKRKQERGEKLSTVNVFYLICQILILIAGIGFSIFIISLTLSVLN